MHKNRLTKKRIILIMEFNKNTIRIKNELYVIKNIKNIDYSIKEIHLRHMTIPIIILITIVFFFYSSVFLSILYILLILLSIPKRKHYEIYIDNNRSKPIHSTFNENEYLKFKDNLENAIEENKPHNEEKIKKSETKEEYTHRKKKEAFEFNLKEQEKKYRKNYENNIQKEKNITKKEPMTYNQKKEKGDDYEKKVAGYYKLDGYDIYLNGIKKGLEDGGIDIICKKDDKVILIQCKNWEDNHRYKIDHNKVKAFHSNCIRYIDENNLIKENTKLIYTVPSKNIFKPSAIKIFKDDYYNCRYEILKFS